MSGALAHLKRQRARVPVALEAPNETSQRMLADVAQDASIDALLRKEVPKLSAGTKLWHKYGEQLFVDGRINRQTFDDVYADFAKHRTIVVATEQANRDAHRMATSERALRRRYQALSALLLLATIATMILAAGLLGRTHG